MDVVDSHFHIQYGVTMRTTLTIDDDVAAAIEQRRRRDGLSLKQVVNTLLRDGLRSRPTPPAKKHRTKTYALRLRPGFDPVKLNQLVDELEDEERLARENMLRS